MAFLVPIFIFLFFYASPVGFWQTLIALFFGLGLLGGLIGGGGAVLNATRILKKSN